VLDNDSLVPVRIEYSVETLFRFDVVPTEQLVKLLERNLNALAKLFGRSGSPSAKSPFQIVDYRQQFMYKGFLLRRRATLGFLRGSLPETIKVRGESQISVFLRSHLGLQCANLFMG
jgi:hypothetical protein